MPDISWLQHNPTMAHDHVYHHRQQKKFCRNRNCLDCSHPKLRNHDSQDIELHCCIPCEFDHPDLHVPKQALVLCSVDWPDVVSIKSMEFPNHQMIYNGLLPLPPDHPD